MGLSHFYRGLEHGIKPCCGLFFVTYHMTLRQIEPLYNSMVVLTDNGGIIYCPECLVERLSEL